MTHVFRCEIRKYLNSAQMEISTAFISRINVWIEQGKCMSGILQLGGVRKPRGWDKSSASKLEIISQTRRSRVRHKNTLHCSTDLIPDYNSRHRKAKAPTTPLGKLAPTSPSTLANRRREVASVRGTHPPCRYAKRANWL
jgi:hypothetical protein